MNNLAKKLIEKGENTIQKQEGLVETAKLLLSANAQEERTLLQNIGLNQEIEFFEAQKINILDKKNKSEQYKKPVVSLKDIQEICMTYRLYFRQSGQYAGKIPAELGAELVSFVKEHEIATGNHQSYSPFYIIAPPEMFLGSSTFVNQFFETNKELKNAYLEKQRDPILLYKIDEDNFAVVKSWGNDFSIIRRFKALMMTPLMLTLMTLVSFAATVYAVEYAIWNLLPQFFNIDLHAEKMTAGDEMYAVFFCIVPSIVVGFLSLLFLFNGDFGIFATLKTTFRRVCTRYRWNR